MYWCIRDTVDMFLKVTVRTIDRFSSGSALFTVGITKSITAQSNESHGPSSSCICGHTEAWKSSSVDGDAVL